jgi:hypothetical protein
MTLRDEARTQKNGVLHCNVSKTLKSVENEGRGRILGPKRQ